MRATGSVWLGAAAGVGTGLAIGAINGAAVALFRFPAFVHTLGMLLTVRAVGMLVTGGHSVGRLPPAVIALRPRLPAGPAEPALAGPADLRRGGARAGANGPRPRVVPDRDQPARGGLQRFARRARALPGLSHLGRARRPRRRRGRPPPGLRRPDPRRQPAADGDRRGGARRHQHHGRRRRRLPHRHRVPP